MTSAETPTVVAAATDSFSTRGGRWSVQPPAKLYPDLPRGRELPPPPAALAPHQKSLVQHQLLLRVRMRDSPFFVTRESLQADRRRKRHAKSHSGVAGRRSISKGPRPLVLPLTFLDIEAASGHEAEAQQQQQTLEDVLAMQDGFQPRELLAAPLKAHRKEQRKHEGDSADLFLKMEQREKESEKKPKKPAKKKKKKGEDGEDVEGEEEGDEEDGEGSEESSDEEGAEAVGEEEQGSGSDGDYAVGQYGSEGDEFEDYRDEGDDDGGGGGD